MRIRNRAECEDIVQNVFIKLWNTGGVENPDQWLHTCVRHECFNYIKHLSRKTKHHELILENSIDYIEALDIKSELIASIDNEIKSLKSQQKKIASLLSIGYSKPEIAEILNISQNTVRVQVMRIRNKLKPLIAEERL